MNKISDQALDIVSQKPRFWRHKFFCQVLSDEIEQWKAERELQKKGQSSYPAVSVDEREFRTLFGDTLNEQAGRMRNFERVLNLLVNLSFGDLGTEANEKYMVGLAHQLAHEYGETIKWSQSFRSLSMPEMYKPLLQEVASYSDNYIRAIETLPQRTLDQLQLIESADSNEPQQLNLVIDVTPHNIEAFERESALLLDKYRRKFAL